MATDVGVQLFKEILGEIAALEREVSRPQRHQGKPSGSLNRTAETQSRVNRGKVRGSLRQTRAQLPATWDRRREQSGAGEELSESEPSRLQAFQAGHVSIDSVFSITEEAPLAFVPICSQTTRGGANPVCQRPEEDKI